MAIKIQRYDYGGRQDRNSARYVKSPSLRRRRRLIRNGALLGSGLIVFALFLLDGHKSSAPTLPKSSSNLQDEGQSANQVPKPVNIGLVWEAPIRNYPERDTFSHKGRAMVAEYQPDSLLNTRVNVYLQRYRPQTGVIMIADLKSGHVLAVGERMDSLVSQKPKLAFGSGYPAASLIKILTAITALECKSKFVSDSIPQWGSFHTLYHSQLRLDRPGRQSKISLELAFAKSVNPAFGLMGLSMGPDMLKTQAAKMGFNQPILPPGVAPSLVAFPDSGFSLAEAACGFTKKTTMSPWHALQIARGAGDDGRLSSCSFVRSITDLSESKEMDISQPSGEYFLSTENLPKLQSLMQATIKMGTARKGFHSILKANQMDKIEAGGKTGSLDGDETPGRFEWFIGYVKLKDQPSKGLAFSIMLVHRDYASIHASEFAALLIRDWLAAYEKSLKEESEKQKFQKQEQAYRAV